MIILYYAYFSLLIYLFIQTRIVYKICNIPTQWPVAYADIFIGRDKYEIMYILTQCYDHYAYKWKDSKYIFKVSYCLCELSMMYNVYSITVY